MKREALSICLLCGNQVTSFAKSHLILAFSSRDIAENGYISWSKFHGINGKHY